MLASAWGMLVNRASTFGGFVAHLGMAVILVGLIGSSMYVTEKTGYVKYDEETDSASEPFVIQDFELRYTGNNIAPQPNDDDILYTVYFDVYKNGEFVGAVDPTVPFVPVRGSSRKPGGPASSRSRLRICSSCTAA